MDMNKLVKNYLKDFTERQNESLKCINRWLVTVQSEYQNIDWGDYPFLIEFEGDIVLLADSENDIKKVSPVYDLDSNIINHSIDVVAAIPVSEGFVRLIPVLDSSDVDIVESVPDLELGKASSFLIAAVIKEIDELIKSTASSSLAKSALTIDAMIKEHIIDRVHDEDEITDEDGNQMDRDEVIIEMLSNGSVIGYVRDTILYTYRDTIDAMLEDTEIDEPE